ncbi:putative damage-inducible protein DinB [Larkinella arboricola]|uniref:Putative damage-inducible protein DinB n=1 Tax=Larkinella arboricola TaxID=643671 RepID=A0A327WTQ3_LARAB|nr:DinB family protein [Larkinella arboricola]RAJ95780.1 putative damage-inducible protein DinB [Larkinella arboricola]
MSQLIEMLLKEMDQEANTTRKMLSRVPNDQYDWQPHPKSMTVRSLATHIAELPTWVSLTLNTDGLDFATTPYQPKEINDTDHLLQYFEESLKEGRDELAKATDEELPKRWVLRNGEEIYSDGTKGEMIRIAYSQIVHHRAQLGVYLRLLNIPIPGSYGPSADEQ